jgi:hypothetical protein
LRLVAVVLYDHLDRVTFEAALQVEKVGIVARGLGDLRRDKGVGLGQVVAQREAHRIGRGRGHDVEQRQHQSG